MIPVLDDRRSIPDLFHVPCSMLLPREYEDARGRSIGTDRNASDCHDASTSICATLITASCVLTHATGTRPHRLVREECANRGNRATPRCGPPGAHMRKADIEFRLARGALRNRERVDEATKMVRAVVSRVLIDESHERVVCRRCTQPGKAREVEMYPFGECDLLHRDCPPPPASPTPHPAPTL